jgi:hypothetical protein
LVVDSGCSGQGVGTSLVRAIQARVARPGKVQCWCTPHSQTMQHLLSRLGFVRAHKAVAVRSGAGSAILPAMWTWRRC